MITEQERIQRETIKQQLKFSIDNNPTLTFAEKQIAKENIDKAAQEADWITEMMRKCGYLQHL